MPATLRSLLAGREFGLRLAAGAEHGDPVLDQPLSWVHSSDLRDPTPWLEPGQLLLTNGEQFVDSAAGPIEQGDAFAHAYVERLRSRGVTALGFATGVVADALPAGLVAVCDADRFPLLEIDARTPFIGIIRHVADVISDDRRARLDWSLDAQRAVARAALRADGLQAILVELSRRLDCWVALYDSARNPLTVSGLLPVPPALLLDVDDAVREALYRGTRAGMRVADHDSGFTLQTMGRSGNLLGVLVVGTRSPLDPAENDLVSSVIGLASIALEQRRTLDSALRRLRTGLFELLLSGVVDVADRTAATLWGPLPEEPVRLTVVSGEVAGQSLFDELELLAVRNDGQLFFAARDDEIVLVSREQDQWEALLARHHLGAGSSAPVGWAELPRALTEARRAALASTRDRPFVAFEHLAEHGLQGLLVASGGPIVAQRMLQPIFDLPARDREVLLHSLRVWLTHNGAWDPAARELGVHRHTLRSRVRVVDDLLGIDLDEFGARAELWSALHLLD